MAELRHITIPPAIDLKVRPTEKSPAAAWTFIHCVTWVVETDKRFNGDGEGARAGQRVIDAMKAPQRVRSRDSVLHVFTLDEKDWKRLQEAMEAPDQGWIFPLTQPGESVARSAPARLFVSYMEALQDENTRRRPRSDEREAKRTQKQTPAAPPQRPKKDKATA